MEPQILDYIKTQAVGVIALEMPDGSPHAAAVHFAHTEDPLVFYFETHQATRKAEALVERSESRASLVIGSDPSTMKTLQLDGVAWILEDEEKEFFENLYLEKFPGKKGKSTGETIYFKFTPIWWRFTDWKTPNGKVIISSEDETL